jgi:hypothetical protein
MLDVRAVFVPVNYPGFKQKKTFFTICCRRADLHELNPVLNPASQKVLDPDPTAMLTQRTLMDPAVILF